MRKQPTRQRAQDQHKGRAHPAVPLGIVQAEQVGVAKQVTVDARQHDARQGIVFQGAARNGLPTGLKGHERNGHQHVPGDIVGAIAPGAKGHDGGGDGAEEGLGGEGGDEGGAAFGAEEAVEAAEEEGADAEAAQRGAGLDPAGAFCGRREAQADVDGVALDGGPRGGGTC